MSRHITGSAARSLPGQKTVNKRGRRADPNLTRTVE